MKLTPDLKRMITEILEDATLRPIEKTNLILDTVKLKGNPMPNPIEIEKQLLSAMVMNNKIIPDVIKQIHPESLEDDTHQAIFRSIITLFKHGHDVGIGLVLAHLAKQDVDVDLGYVDEILSYFKTHKAYNRHVALLSRLKKA